MYVSGAGFESNLEVVLRLNVLFADAICILVFALFRDVWLLFLSFLYLLVEMIHAAPPVTAKSWIIVDGNSGEVLASKHPKRLCQVASITKVMTCHLVLRLAEEDPDVLSCPRHYPRLIHL